MRSIAIIGSGPTGLYTFQSLLEAGDPLAVTIFEQGERAGVGMPYDDDANTRLMLANIASIEIPPIGQTYLDWLREQPEEKLRRYGVDPAGLHERQFLPRILLGEYFRHRLLWLVDEARACAFVVTIRESCRVVDIEARPDGVGLWAKGEPEPLRFDWAAIATGHVWPDADEATRRYFPSPWSGLVEASIPAMRVGIMGTSLSAIDAAMAVVSQHGQFVTDGEHTIDFALDTNSEGLEIVLMSRSGILPEADFYCPIPYEPLSVCTPDAIAQAIEAGPDGLLDRAFALMAEEIALADPAWSARVDLGALDADTFAEAYFADRTAHDPFRWAHYNLMEAEANKRARITVPWRYAILRLHEAIQPLVPALDEADRERFDGGLAKVFMDNYAAIPAESIRRLLALHRAGVLRLLELGADYEKKVDDTGTTITVANRVHHFAVFIDARGQRPLVSQDLPFPRLREQLITGGQDIPQVCDDYSLDAPAAARGRIALGALPYLLHDQPFVQGITASAEIGAKMAGMTQRSPSRLRRFLEQIWA